MALCPFAKHLLIPPGSNDPRITPRIAILHVDAGNAESLFTFFRDRSGGIESHFHVRKDGVIEQYRDTNFQADANLDANDFAVSIETQGFGAGEWTPLQLASIKRLLLWLHNQHGIPLQKVARWDGSGVGYHTLFGAPSHWTPVAKSCPGPDRIKQFNNVLVPWMRTATSKPPAVVGAYTWHQPGALGSPKSGCILGVRKGFGSLVNARTVVGSRATSEGGGIRERPILLGRVVGNAKHKGVAFPVAAGHAPPGRAPKARDAFVRAFAKVPARFKGGDLNLTRRLAARATGRRVVGDGVVWLVLPRVGWKVVSSEAVYTGGDHRAVLARVKHKRTGVVVRILVINCMSVSAGPARSAGILTTGLTYHPDVVMGSECADFRAATVDARANTKENR